MRKKLTERQQMIYDFIAETIRSRGAPPTIREIMDVFEINSTNGVRTTLAALEKKGIYGGTRAYHAALKQSTTLNPHRLHPIYTRSRLLVA